VDLSHVGTEAPRHGSHHRFQAIRDTEARIKGIQRQNIRFHHVLDSAIRVMSMHVTHGTVLKVAYFDEIDTVIGPMLDLSSIQLSPESGNGLI
jgi:hypothetical protein